MNFHLASVVLLYLDPGTGSLLFSAVMGIITTAYFMAKNLCYKVIGNRLSVLGQRSHIGEERASLLLYSEGKQYFSSFQPLLAEISRRGLPCVFLTSDPNDPGLGYASDAIRTKCI